MKIQGRTSAYQKESYPHTLYTHFLRKIVFFVLVSCISLLLSACGGNSEESEGSSISGYVIDGPISGSTVTLHRVNLDGSIGGQVAGPFITDSRGQWTGNINDDITGQLVVVAVGGQYIDDATNETITLAPDEILRSWFDTSDPGSSGVVSPITDSLWQVARKEMSQGATLADAISTTEQLANDFWGFNPANLTPDEASATPNEQRYGVMLATISFLLDNNTALQQEPFASMPRFTLVRLIINDMADGRLDGLDINGQPILAADGTPLPALSRHDLSAFFKEANDRAESLQINPVEDDPRKQHNHNTYSLSCPDNGVYLYGPYVDNLPPGSGVTDISPSLPGSDTTYDKVIRLDVDLDEVEILRNENTNAYTGEAFYTDFYTVPFEQGGLLGGLDLTFVVNGSASKGSGVTNWRIMAGGGSYFGEIGTYDPELVYLSNEHIRFVRRASIGYHPGFAGEAQAAYICGSAMVGAGGSYSYPPAGQTHDDKHFVGGYVSGLSGAVVLQNNAGNDLTIDSTGSYNFSTPLFDDAFYNVSILTQPATQTCTLARSAGQIDGQNITSVSVSCEGRKYSVSGTINGLGESDALVLQNNAGDDLSFSQNGIFTFETQLESDATYNVSVLSDSISQTCNVTNGTGTVSNNDVTNVQVSCSDLQGYTIGGTIIGLNGDLELTSNSGDIVQTSVNGVYHFSGDFYPGELYVVSISSSPSVQNCSIANPNGIIDNTDINNIAVTCTTPPSDTTPPTVSSRNPTDGATGVVTSTSVRVTLSEPLALSTVTSGALTLANGDSIAGVVSLSNNDQTITFTPSEALLDNTSYTATLADSITDVAGNSLAAAEIWSFTTAGTDTNTASVIYTVRGAPVTLRRADIENQVVTTTDVLSNEGWSNVHGEYFFISPDGRMAALLARADLTSGWELYVVPVAGGTPIKVSGTLVTNGNVQDFKWSPDSTRIAYIADKDTSRSYELYVVTADGVTETKVNPPLSAGQRVDSYHWAPNSNLIAYTADQLVETEYQLIISAPNGTGNTIVPKLDGLTAHIFSEGRRMAWSPDSSQLAYAGQASNAISKILVVGANGLAPTYLSAPEITDAGIMIWAPDGSAVASILKVGSDQLIISPADGSTYTAITNLPSSRRVRSIAWAPDSSLIAYSSDRDTDNIYELSVVAPDGSGLVDVSDSLGATARVAPYAYPAFEWSANSQNLLFIAAPVVDNQNDLYLVSRSGQNPLQLTNRMDTERFSGAVFSPDGKIAYALWNDDEQRMVYAVALDGSGETSVIDSLVTEDVETFQVVDDAGVSKRIYED